MNDETLASHRLQRRWPEERLKTGITASGILLSIFFSSFSLLFPELKKIRQSEKEKTPECMSVCVSGYHWDAGSGMQAGMRLLSHRQAEGHETHVVYDANMNWWFREKRRT